MSRTETPSRYGRTAVNHAELPASPAAATNGSRGKQQLEAASALASAAVLATIVPRPVWRLSLVTIVLSGAEFPNGLPDERNARRALGNIPGAISAAAHTRSTT